MTSFYSSGNISKLQEINLQNVDFSQGASKAISAIQGSMQTAQGPKRVTLPNASHITADLVKNLVNSIETKNDKNRVFIDVTNVMAKKSEKEALTTAFEKRIVYDGDRTFISSPEKTPQSRKRKLEESEKEGEGPKAKKAKTEKEGVTAPTTLSQEEQLRFDINEFRKSLLETAQSMEQFLPTKFVQAYKDKIEKAVPEKTATIDELTAILEGLMSEFQKFYEVTTGFMERMNQIKHLGELMAEASLIPRGGPLSWSFGREKHREIEDLIQSIRESPTEGLIRSLQESGQLPQEKQGGESSKQTEKARTEKE